MRLLLDTRAYLWWLTDDPRLSDRAREAIASPDSVVHVSAASLWEISTLVALGRLEASADFAGEIEADGFVELPISARHAGAAGALPRASGGATARVLAAQASVEELTLVAPDRLFAGLPVEVLDAEA